MMEALRIYGFIVGLLIVIVLVTPWLVEGLSWYTNYVKEIFN